MSLMEFKSITWLLTNERVHQCINATKFKFVKDKCRFYLKEIFKDYHWTKPCIGPCLWKNLIQHE